MIDPIVILLIVYGVTTLATVLVTLADYIDQVGGLDLTGLLYGLRELTIVAIEIIWWIVILKAWGLLNIPWQAEEISLSEPSGQLVYIFVLSVALLIALLYWDGHIGSSAGVALISALILNAFIDLGFLGVLLVVGAIVLVLTAWILGSEIRTKIPVKKKKAGL
uniref:Transmembrane protein n=1 Tax=archaeon enrichment culture clone 1(2010) TaxID=795325 RepID=D9CGH7_9ARCH|nr:hypothetical protein pHA1_gp53 [archaeon enrichment culture clone 1(2010)]